MNEIIKLFPVKTLQYGGVQPFDAGEKILDIEANEDIFEKIKVFLAKNYQVSFTGKDNAMAENKSVVENKSVNVKSLVSDGQTVEMVTVELPKNMAEFLKNPTGQIIASQLDCIIASAKQEAEKEKENNTLKEQTLNNRYKELLQNFNSYVERVKNLEDWSDSLKLPSRKKVEQDQQAQQAQQPQQAKKA